MNPMRMTCSLLAVLVLAGTAASAQPRPPPPPAPKVSPVERPIAGDMGISFAFKGLAPMAVGGVADATIGQVFGAEVGFRYMLADKWALPVSFGAAMLNVSPPGGGDNNKTHFGLGF